MRRPIDTVDAITASHDIGGGDLERSATKTEPGSAKRGVTAADQGRWIGGSAGSFTLKSCAENWRGKTAKMKRRKRTSRRETRRRRRESEKRQREVNLKVVKAKGGRETLVEAGYIFRADTLISSPSSKCTYLQ